MKSTRFSLIRRCAVAFLRRSPLEKLDHRAEAVGLASCWIHRAKEEFDSEEGKAILRDLGIEGDYEGIDHLVVGYPAKALPSPLPRKADYIRWVE